MKIAVGMSGGVDSSVAACLLKKQGHDIVGTIMTTWDKKNPGTTASKGNFVDLDGTILGEHKGIWNYTIGQRKGLGVSHCKPLYVIEINAEKNEIVLGENDSLLTKKLKAKQCNYISLDKPERVLVKIRSNTQAVPCSVTYGDDSFSIIFDQAQRAVTPGQSAVLYANDIVIGGGFISKDTV